MKNSILIFGAGAIGTYLAVNLACAGQQIVILEREKDIPFLRREGLTLKEEGKIRKAENIQFISKLADIRSLDIDLVVLALKTYHLYDLIPELVQLEDDLPPLLCLQNGVDSEQTLREALSSVQVISGTVTSAVDRLRKGQAQVRKLRGVGIAGSHPLTEELLFDFKQAGLAPRHYRDEEAMKWSKLITNLLGNASSAILDLPPGEIYAHNGLYKVELTQTREALQVMHRKAVPAVNLPGIPVKILAGVVKYLPGLVSKPLLSRVIGAGRGEKMPSFHIDLYNGRGESEVDQLNGAVVRAGEQVNFPAPVNKFLYQTLTSLLTGDLPLNSYRGKPERFLKDIKRFQERTISANEIVN